MKSLFVVSILILAFCAASIAQTDQSAKCPTVSIIGPASIVNPGETGMFTAIINKEQRDQYIYSWTITGATIIEEKGKDVIDLGKAFESVGKTQIRFRIPPEMAGESTMGTVEVKGLPEGCPNTASESFIFCPVPVAEINEFSISPTQIDKAKLAGLAEELENNPSAQIYIVERFEKKILPQTVKRKRQKTIDYLKESGMDPSRFTLIYGYADITLTQIILVPSGAMPPVCNDCEDVEPK